MHSANGANENSIRMCARKYFMLTQSSFYLVFISDDLSVKGAWKKVPLYNRIIAQFFELQI